MVKTRRRKTVKNRTMKKQIKNRQLRKRRTKKRGGAAFVNSNNILELNEYGNEVQNKIDGLIKATPNFQNALHRAKKIHKHISAYISGKEELNVPAIYERICNDTKKETYVILQYLIEIFLILLLRKTKFNEEKKTYCLLIFFMIMMYDTNSNNIETKNEDEIEKIYKNQINIKKYIVDVIEQFKNKFTKEQYKEYTTCVKNTKKITTNYKSIKQINNTFTSTNFEECFLMACQN